MKVVAVSDIHMRNIETPPADLLLVAGDMTFRGDKEELDWYEDWLSSQPQRHKVWIAGNHELGIERFPTWASRIAKNSNSIYLEDSGVEIEGLSLWGSPMTPWFRNWAFNRHRGEEIKTHWRMIPEGTDILMTHGPPFGYMDLSREGEHVGCEDLLDVLNYLDYPPQVLVFGHIHGGYGEEEHKRPDGKIIKLINASTCDEKYLPTNQPIIFEI
ncbi:MAG: metallophosphatase domain-containing protein [Candidatus Obscuribacterales bacterium]|nr:metallophosphatase domain-containing protein [Candidatus Obscuribacterales bacterium]